MSKEIMTGKEKPSIGVPTIWFGNKPDWALDFGNGSSTQYLWANYPELNNLQFKDILTTLSTAGWMTAYDTNGFYVPDLRGIVPIGYGTNAKRTSETTAGGSLGSYSASTNKSHDHTASSSSSSSSSSGSSFSGNNIYGSFGFTSKSDCYLTVRYVDGCFGTWNQTIRSVADYTSSSTGAGTVYFSATPSGTVTTTTTTTTTTSTTVNAAGGNTSKPASLAVMWIVRFE